MRKIKVVMAKHTGCEKKYIFAIPGYMTVERGDALIVDTMYGRKLATAVTGEIEIGEDDAEQLGAYKPLKNVQERASAEIRQMILTDMVNRMDRDLRDSVIDDFPY